MPQLNRDRKLNNRVQPSRSKSASVPELGRGVDIAAPQRNRRVDNSCCGGVAARGVVVVVVEEGHRQVFSGLM